MKKLQNSCEHSWLQRFPPGALICYYVTHNLESNEGCPSKGAEFRVDIATRGWKTDCSIWECSHVFCLYVCVQVSGLSVWIGRQLEPMSGLPPWAVTLLACLLVSAVTEFASNPATLTVFLPILSALVRHTLFHTLSLRMRTVHCYWSSQISGKGWAGIGQL